ncbi:L-histidine N(alpha)-methyltransferase [Cellvibrio japonicus]|uniref:EpoC n=1 Tax=Cellvibrio japonicus (strain Ueda107) TaxID=498211 RepID=B3PCU2_CELJU|nr:SDR family NAD(P)-dependent oxidoreductase [Cellvibrio japonicus]ACE82625.1 EpoC [Cellvibrio japonicus Ueda107]QEI13311.1 SDR family NAD(P)-dependent oxidoreductase [Cellvibrio japonicus]QEI16885.1 SDR family NAD(P)-dependent oxidoreductase [Cellvibrio japonicus]QEI20463.1 SDR family NAD(P)-dependent oxidoreductase [Cellvibrio japonicus]
MNDVAIIGMACRFPGAQNVEEFETNLWAGKESIRTLTREELRLAGVPDEWLANPGYIPVTSSFADVESFDADFFKYSSREARRMDPQQRCLLECAWEALEHAGYSQKAFDYPVGVFAGASSNTYLLNNMLRKKVALNLDFMEYLEDRQGGDKDFIATRVAYKMNLCGPAFTVQSACSTSLVAVHTACQSLLNGECDMALAGAVTVMYPLDQGYWHKEGSMVSPDGHCRTFSDRAQGTVFGNGVGVIVLKRLEDALAERANILGVIKGSAMNNDGAVKPSYTAPSLDKQSEVISDALAIADVNPDTILFVEAHGTGTPMGDPIEVAALTQAYRDYTDKRQFCALGSVKTNIGHLDVAAGMAGIIKTLLVLKNHSVPPTLHFNAANPAIDFVRSPFFVNTDVQPLPDVDTPARAGITSLGVGGTNVHMILEAHTSPDSYSPDASAELLLLSAKTPEALAAVCSRMQDHLARHPSLSLADVAFTLKHGRIAWPYRVALVANDVSQCTELLTHTPVMTDEARSALCLWVPELSITKLKRLYLCLKPHAILYEEMALCLSIWNEWSTTQTGSIPLMPGCTEWDSILDVIASEGDFLPALDSKRAGNIQAHVIALMLSIALGKALRKLCGDALMMSGEGKGALAALCVSGELSLEEVFAALFVGDESLWLDDAHAKLPDRESLTPEVLLVSLDSSSPTEVPFIPQDEDPLRVWPMLLARCWMAGIFIDWSGEPIPEGVKRVVLPTYPFQRQMFNFESAVVPVAGISGKPNDGLPDLIHRHLSAYAWKSEVFESQISLARQAYFDHHRVFGVAIVPGSFHLSLVFSSLALRYPVPQKHALTIENLVFGKALVLEAEDTLAVQVLIEPGQENDFAKGQSRYRLVSQRNNDELQVHSQGDVLTRMVNREPLDLMSIRNRCTTEYPVVQFYEEGWHKGFEWREDFRSLTAIHYCDGEALAEVQYSPALAGCLADYSIHPAILDVCLQPYLAAVLAHPVYGVSDEPYIPLSIDRVTFFQQPCSQQSGLPLPAAKLFVHAKLRNQDSQSRDSFAADLNICSANGEPVMSVEGLRTWRMSRQAMQDLAPKKGIGDLILLPKWVPESPEVLPSARVPDTIWIFQDADDDSPFATHLAGYWQGHPIKRVLLGSRYCEHTPDLVEIDCTQAGDIARVLQLLPDSIRIYFLGGLYYPIDNGAAQDVLAQLAQSQARGPLALLKLMTALARAPTRAQRQALELVVLTRDLYDPGNSLVQLNPYSGALTGLVKVFARENSWIKSICVDLDARECIQSDQLGESLALIEGLAKTDNIRELAIRGGACYGRYMYRTEKLTESIASASGNNPQPSAFRHKGVYWILGGAGGIGEALSYYLAERYQATLVWIGRRPLNDQIQGAIDQVAHLGGKALYFSADACDFTEMARLHSETTADIGAPNGVIHSALVLRDQSIAKMTEEEFRAAFDIKVKASVILDLITRSDGLDFFTSFSSENAIRGWHGLSNYVSGCTFQDNYLHYLRHDRDQNTTIFNWGFWCETGIAAQARIRQLVEHQGILGMTTHEGMDVVEAGLGQLLPQLMPIKFQPQIAAHLGVKTDALWHRASCADVSPGMQVLRQAVDKFSAGYERDCHNEPWQTRVNVLARVRMLDVLDQLGVTLSVGHCWQPHDWMRQQALRESLLPLIEAIAAICVEQGWATEKDRELVFTQACVDAFAQVADYPCARQALVEAYPSTATWFAILDASIAQFARVLRNALPATDVLFPQSSIALVEGVYRNNPASDFFNAVVRELVTRYGADRDDGCVIRLLEFGAGTGSTTRLLLQALRPFAQQVDYVFTDVSPHFTQLAREQFAAEFPFVSFSTLDMEKDIRGQGYERQHFDMVFGTNVIHVCRDIHATVMNLKQLIKPGGLLVVNELTARSDIWTLTFGLLDSWWLSRDAALRIPHTPLLSVGRWKEILSVAGFREPTAFTQPGLNSEAEAVQAVLVAQSDGCLLVPQQAPAPVSAMGKPTERSHNPQMLQGFNEVVQSPLSERRTRLLRYLQGKVADLLEIDSVDAIPLDQPVGGMGMDSLIVLSFCKVLSKDMDTTVPTNMVFDHPTLNDMANYLYQDICQWPLSDDLEAVPVPSHDTASRAVAPGWQASSWQDLDTLTSEQLSDLLEAELND